MELKEIELVLERANAGDYSTRIDERMVEPELRPMAHQVNQAIDQLVEAADTKRKSDTMIRDNPLAIAVLRKDKSRININKQYEIAWHGTNDELMRKKLYDFDITVLSGEHFYACYETKKLAITEAMVKWPDGSKSYLTLYAIPILDENREIEGAFYVWVDYTDAHKKMEEVKAMQYRVDTMIQANPLAIAVLRKDKSRISINKQYEIAWRGSNEELMRKKLYDFDITVLSGEHFYACFETKKLAVTESMVKWPDGSKSYLTLYAIPILDEQGELDGAFYVWVDYTDAHKKMEEVKAMQYRVDTMIQANPLAIAVLRKDKSRISINKQYEIAWRGSNEELMRKKLYDFDITVLSGEHFYACFETKKLAVTESMVKWPDGSKSYLTLYAIPILDEQGELDGAFYVWVDYTDAHKKMEEVKAMQHRVDTMIQANPLAIAVLRKDKSRISINKQYEIAWRGSNEELMRKKLYDFDITVLSGEHFYACFETKKLAVTESMVKWPDGSKSYLTLYAIPILDEQGELDGAFYVWVDYTDAHTKMEEIKVLMEDSHKKAAGISESAAALQHCLSRMAEGDLSVNADIVQGDPLIVLKQDYNKAVESIKKLVEEIAKSTVQLDSTTKETSKSSQEILKSTEQVAKAAQETADGTKKQMDEIEKVSKDVADLSASIEEIASTTHDLMDHAQKAASEGNQAAELGKIATTKMSMVEKISGESVTEITALNERMKEISNIVRMIADISSQTNLLALNAAIEAARAGEHGRGFAVVAGEVRNLAGESKTATNHIEGLIESIQKNTDKTSAAIKSSYEEIQTGIDSVNKTIDALNRIITESNVVAEGVTEITKATEDQAEATNRVMQGMEQTSSITRQNQERMEDMAALAEESSASTEEIAGATRELTTMAERLKSLMNKFKVR